MKYFIRFIVSLLIGISLTSEVAATTKTFFPSDDTYLNGARAGTDINYGSHPSLRLGDTAGVYFLPLMRFSLDSIPTDKVITSAKLQLYFRQTLDNTNLQSGDYVVIPIKTAWNEQTVAWINRPSKNAQGIQSDKLTIINKEAGYQEWDITSVVQSWINDPGSNQGFYLEPKTNGWSCGFDSGEGQYSPKLVIEYGLSLPVFIKPVIKFIPGLVEASPTPSPTPTPSPSPSPEPTTTPSPRPTAVASPTPKPVASPSPTPAPINVERGEIKEKDLDYVIVGLTVIVGACAIASAIIINKLRKGRGDEQQAAKSKGKK